MIDGRCDCGKVRYRLKQEPLFVHCCHCTWCQRETGSAFAINALIESSEVEFITGQPVIVDTPSASGIGQQILRCPDCQVALLSYYGGSRGVTSFVRVGTLDDPARYPPDIHIFTSTKRDFFELDPNVPAVPEYYDPADYWPATSLERRARARQT